MKLTVKLLSVFSIALGLCSCAKEQVHEGKAFRLVEKTFYISHSETKTALDGNNVVWQSGDKVTLFDNIQNVALPDAQVSDNQINAQVTDGAASFYAVYPANSEATISGSVINTVIPNEQIAVPNSFGNGSNVSVAYTTSEDNRLSFKNVGALLKFTLTDNDVVSVKVLGNNNEKISGKADIDYNSGNPTVSASEVSVTLRNADKSALSANVPYYIVVAPATFSRGITLVMTKSDNTFATKQTSASVSLTRNSIKNLGNISGSAYSNDRYTAFMGGASIEIAGMTYNKADFAATDILALNSSDPTQADLYSQASGKNRILFLEGDGFTTSKSIIVSKNIVLVSRYEGQMAKFSPLHYGSLRANGAIAMKDVYFSSTQTAGGNSFNNNSTTGHTSNFHFDGCKLELNKTLIYASETTFGISSIRLKNCNVNYNLASGKQLINLGTSTVMAEYKDIQIDNNVFYSPVSIASQFVNCNSASTLGNQDNNIEISFRNNIVYNIGSPNGLLNHVKVNSLEVGGNIYHSPLEGKQSKTYYLWDSSQDKNVIKISGDIVYGLPESSAWYYSGNANGRIDSINKLTNNSEDPFESFSTADGSYSLKPAYSSYGPQK